MNRITVVTRSFQGGATFDSFNKKKCDEGLIFPLKKLLTTSQNLLNKVIVVTCSEKGSRFAEEVLSGETPTTKHVKEALSEFVKSGLLEFVLCEDWGLNAGSASALNAGISATKNSGSEEIIFWSPEIDLDGQMISLMRQHMDTYALELVGYARSNWYHRLQWMFAQNTISLWSKAALNEVAGFDPICNGDGIRSVATIEHGDVPLAGMEDFHTYLRLASLRGTYPRWGLVSTRNPTTWNLALIEPGTARYVDLMKKISRQAPVMEAYNSEILPGTRVDEFMRHAWLA